MGKIKIALIGAGQRGINYVAYVRKQRLDAEVVAVADPNPARRRAIQEMFDLEDGSCYENWETLLDNTEKLADAVFVCTQDRMHMAPTLKALAAGYHVLLEKPMSTEPEECIQMAAAAKKHDRLLVICHVLRYTHFFSALKRLLDEGAIGKLTAIQHNENVGYWHQAHSFVRGNWRNTAESSPMILSKSSHDLDILLWLAGEDCVRLSSFGSLSYFHAGNAPEGAPNRCLEGCPVSDTCEYYAPKHYLTDNVWWPTSAIGDDMSYEGRVKALEEGPYGRCVFRCDNDVVDHQVVNMEFASGLTAAFTMSAFTRDVSRTIKLMGTKGEIRGAMEKDEIEVIRFDTGFSEIISLKSPGGHVGHGGGDGGLIRDFLKLLKSGGSNSSLTSAENSVQSHLMAFAAEESRLSKRVVEMKEYREKVEESYLHV